MDVMSYSEARKNLKALMDRVVDDCTETIITRRNGRPVVMMSLDSWTALTETEYLLSTPGNVARLERGIAQFRAGEGVEHDLVKP